MNMLLCYVLVYCTLYLMMIIFSYMIMLKIIVLNTAAHSLSLGCPLRNESIFILSAFILKL